MDTNELVVSSLIHKQTNSEAAANLAVSCTLDPWFRKTSVSVTNQDLYLSKRFRANFTNAAPEFFRLTSQMIYQFLGQFPGRPHGGAHAGRRHA